MTGLPGRPEAEVTMKTDKRYAEIIALCTACAMTISGCGLVNIPDLSDEQNQLISEYSVDLLLKYGAPGHSRILSAGEVKQAEESVAESEKAHANERAGVTSESSKAEMASSEAAGGTDKTVISDTTINKFYGINGVDISYTGDSVCSSYPDASADQDTTQGSTSSETAAASETANENMYYSVDADPGKKLIVLKFKAVNNTDQSVNLDMTSYPLELSVSLDGGNDQKILTTLVPYDIAAYKDTIQAGQSAVLVCMIQTDENKAASVKQINMTMVNGDQTATIALKK